MNQYQISIEILHFPFQPLAKNQRREKNVAQLNFALNRICAMKNQLLLPLGGELIGTFKCKKSQIDHYT